MIFVLYEFKEEKNFIIFEKFGFSILGITTISLLFSEMLKFKKSYYKICYYLFYYQKLANQQGICFY